MARADRVKISVGMTIPTNVQYESIRFDASFETDVPDAMSREAAAEILKGQAEEIVKKAVAEYKAEMNGAKKSKK